MNSSKLVLAPYKLESKSAINLTTALTESLKLRVRRLYTDDRGTFQSRDHNIIINWGSSSLPSRIIGRGRVINHPDAVKVAGNKLSTFEQLHTHEFLSMPLYTTDKSVAEEWINEGKVVVQRTKLQGHSGAGIILAARVEDLVDCPLYVQYIKKSKEFRVHVAFGKVIDVQAKRKRTTDFEGEVNYAIRNHQNGWVYCREEIEEPLELRQLALASVLTLGLDFGAVDIIYNQHYNKCYVLEVNTAPGLEGTSVEIYKNAFMEIV